MEFHTSTVLEAFNRIFSIRFDTADIDFGLHNSKSGASFTLSIGPLHFAYTNLNIMGQYIAQQLKEIDNEFNSTREIREIGQDDEEHGQERILH